LLVSGGNSQIVLVESPSEMKIVGQTIDDAAGEAFDKCAKVMNLPYPGGPIIDRLAQQGNPKAFVFNKPRLEGFDYSFSGLKTSFMYFLRDELKNNPNFVEERKADLCASIQKTVIEVLMKKLKKAADDYKIKRVAVAGGVSANSGLRAAFEDYSKRYGWEIFLPKFAYTTDNAAMIAITALFKYKDGIFDTIDSVPFSKVVI
jgi:N6-L-threonylcarbamoyladenine synthase